MQNCTRIAHGSCKILRRNIHYKHARMPIDFLALGRCKTRRILQYSRTAKCDFAAKYVYTAVGAKFRFKFICHYVANFIQFMRTAINFILKFLHRRACKHSLVKHAICSRTTKHTRTKHRAPNSFVRRSRSIGFWRATRVLALQISRCERLRYSATSLQRATNFSLIYSHAAS